MEIQTSGQPPRGKVTEQTIFRLFDPSRIQYGDKSQTSIKKTGGLATLEIAANTKGGSVSKGNQKDQSERLLQPVAESAYVDNIMDSVSEECAVSIELPDSQQKINSLRTGLEPTNGPERDGEFKLGHRRPKE